MSPAVKTFLKVLLGTVATAAAGVLASPENFVGFASLAGILSAIGAFIASKLEALAAR